MKGDHNIGMLYYRWQLPRPTRRQLEDADLAAQAEPGQLRSAPNRRGSA
jgi:hypothetical protein